MVSLLWKGKCPQAHCSLLEFEVAYRPQHIEWLHRHQTNSLKSATAISDRAFEALKNSFARHEIAAESLFWDRLHPLVQSELKNYRKQMSQNFGLDPAEFQQLLSGLQRGDERMFERVFLSHYQDCMAYLVRKYKASQVDAYDMTMETLITFRRRMLEGKITYGNLRFLFTQMAGQLYLKWVKKKREKVPLSEIELEDPEEEMDESTLFLLENAWTQLCGDCQELLQQFYYQGRQLKEIATQVAKTPAALRKQKQRCLEKLRQAFLTEYHK